MYVCHCTRVHTEPGVRPIGLDIITDSWDIDSCARAEKRLTSSQNQPDTDKRVRTRGSARPFLRARYLLEPTIEICHVDDIDQETLRKLVWLHDTSERALYTPGHGGGLLYVAPTIPRPEIDMRTASNISVHATREQLALIPVPIDCHSYSRWLHLTKNVTSYIWSWQTNPFSGNYRQI